MTALSLPLTHLQRHWQNINTLSLLQPLCNQFQSKTSGQSLSTGGLGGTRRQQRSEMGSRAVLFLFCFCFFRFVLIAQKDVNNTSSTNNPLPPSLHTYTHTQKKVLTSLGSTPPSCVILARICYLPETLVIWTLPELLRIFSKKKLQPVKRIYLRDSGASQHSGWLSQADKRRRMAPGTKRTLPT